MLNRLATVESRETTATLAPLPSSSGSDLRLRALVHHFGRVKNLSPQQTAVVNLAICGVHRKECAAQLSCSLKTIEGYWRRIFEKTRCRSDAEVIALFIREAVRTRQAQRAT